MKNFSLKIFYIFLLGFNSSCNATQFEHLKWNVDGSIHNSNNKQISLELENIYSGINYSNKLYVVGFKIDHQGINHPTLVEISSDMGTTKYWPFEQPLATLFVYKNKLHTNNMSGDSFSLDQNNWNKTDLKLPTNSSIVYSNNKEHLVICHPSSLFKELHENSSCYSIKPDWKQNFVWRTTKPVVCNDKLHIFEEQKKGGFFKQLSLENGKTLYSKKLEHLPEDLCKIHNL